MDSIRVERLRSLSDTGYIEIKPITVLLGQNSSGKSTFLRVLPLLKQSLESRKTGPILWYGPLVDFGSFEDAHQQPSAEDTIVFSFKFRIEKGDDSRFFRRMDSTFLLFGYDEVRILSELNVSLELEIKEHQSRETTRVSRITLLIEDTKIELNFDEDENVSKFDVNSLNVLKSGIRYVSQKANGRSLLPIIAEVDPKKDSSAETIGSTVQITRAKSRPFRTLPILLIHKVKQIAHSSTSVDTVVRIASSFGIGSSEAMLTDIQKNAFSRKSWTKITSKWKLTTEEFIDLKDLIIANSTPFILDKCDEIIAIFSKRITYMGPVRATAERYYRIQDLALDEIDYQGQNLAMFLRNLTEPDMESFANWTLHHFGFSPSINKSLGHLSLKIRPKDLDRELNIADTGFGFSQILPIITQLWMLSVFSADPRRNRMRRNSSRETVTYAIEQPELHLHPRMQGVLTDALIAGIKEAEDNNINLRLVIETHSETLVNRLGHLIAEGKVSSESINIILFEPSDTPGEIRIKKSHFDSDGYLLDWPLGFFEMELL